MPSALSDPIGRVLPAADEPGATVARRTRRILFASLAISNVIGAAVVFVLAVWVVPNPQLQDEAGARTENLVALVGFLALAVPGSIAWGRRRILVSVRWLVEDRDPTEDEQRAVLRGPLRAAGGLSVVWAIGAVVFTALNLSIAPRLGLIAGVTVVLGGVTTTALTYLLCERLLRPVAARALEKRLPEQPMLPGVLARVLIGWALGTGVPLIGVVVIAALALADDRISVDELAVAALGLAAVALLVGLLAVVLAARAVADPVNSVRSALDAVRRGDYDARIAVFDGSEVGLLQAGFNRMVGGLRERERLRETFGTYLDEEVAKHVLSEGPKLEGEEVEASIVFVDIRGFTSLAERLPASDIVATLNRMFGRIVPPIREHGGHVDKYVGDGLMAVFGALGREDDHARQAVAAAQEIAEAVEDEFGGDLEVGIGVNTGTVVAGNVGGAGRLEFSVIGDAVNVAARVEAATRETGDTILITEATRAARGDADIELEERPPVPLKGKDERVPLFAPASPAPDRAG